MAMSTLHTSADLDAALAASHERAIVLFKHSATCPFSARAQEQVANAKDDIDIYAIVVQYADELSQEIVRRLAVEHASPQAIVVRNGEAVWNGWRSEIKTEELKRRVEGMRRG